jgi:uncharacterized integral membrane protein (TIGR00698 family)
VSAVASAPDGSSASGRSVDAERGSSARGLRGFVALVPGLVLLAVIGYAGKVAESSIKAYGAAHKLALPNIEYVFWAILFGLLIGNVFGRRPWFRVFEPGIGTYELWLKVGIVLLGVRFLFADLAKLGAPTLALVVLEIVLAGGIMIGLARLFGLGPKLTALLAIGSSVCGVSAIIATRGAIDAEEDDTAFAIASILVIGALSLFAFPLVAHALGMSDRAFGVWAGLGIDNTAEVAAAGALYSDDAAKIAVLVKTARNAMIGFVVLGAALYFASRGGRGIEGSKAAFLWKKFPKFVLGFVAFSALASLHVFRAPQVTSLANVSRWAFLLTFAGVGLRTNTADMKKKGLRPFLVGAIAELAIAAVTLGLVIGADRFIGLR